MNSALAYRQTPIRGEQLRTLMRQLRSHAGIKINSSQGVIEDCIRQRMASLEMVDMDEYLGLLEGGISARAEWLALIDLLTVKETRFFRQPAAFEWVAQYVSDLFEKGPVPKEFSFWSAGCATGQELYSLAMVVDFILRQHQPWLEWHGVGTDISFMAINQAQEARYHESALKTVPAAYRDAYAEPAADGEFQVSAELRARTHFFHSNLLHVSSAPFTDLNIIFCQNVLIYFEREKQRWIIDQLAARLRVGGLLILGAGEDVRWLNSNMRRMDCPGVCAYQKIGG